MSRFIGRNLKKITAQGKRVRDVSDGRVPGLTLVVQKSGVQSWTLRYRFGEHQRRYLIGHPPEISAVRARQIAQGILQKVAAGVDPQAQKAADRSGETKDAFPDQAIRFVETYCQRNKTWRAQATMLGLQLDLYSRRNPALERRWSIIANSPADRWRKRNVGSITRREIVEAVHAETARGPIWANRVHATLRRFFSWAVETGVIETSFAIGTKPPSPEKSRDRVLSQNELILVWCAAGELGDPFRAFIRLMVLLGQRRGEIAGMMVDEITERGTLWTLPAARSKNGEEHQVPLPQAAQEVLATLPRSASGLIFTSNDKTAIGGFSRLKIRLDETITRLNKGKELPQWTWHDIRRSVASGMAAMEIQPHVIEAVLNHRSGVISGVARTYNRHSYFAEKKDALERWARLVAVFDLM